MSKNFIFIDSRVAEYRSIVAGIGGASKYMIIDAGSDGILQMQDALSGYDGLDSIHVISHGSPGALYLGSTLLNPANLSGYKAALKNIGASLSESGDLLLYGCDVGQGEIGKVFVNSLANLTGADVAASSNHTFAMGDVSDFSLEVASGVIESDLVLAAGNNIVSPLAVISGDAQNNILYGTAENDTFYGGGGGDTFAGGLGNDTYVVDSLSDVVTELSGQGSDLIQTSLTYSLMDTDGSGANGGNVENLRLTGSGNVNATGNALSNTLYANSGNNILNGVSGSDTASYQYASAAVAVSLALSGAQATGGSGSDTLKNIDNLTGSAYGDRLKGDGNANVLNGLAGADTLVGGDGSDTYYVDTSADQVIEANPDSRSGGVDLVISTASSFTLSENIENGRISASGTSGMIGNSLGNVIYAGRGDNYIDGGAGFDFVSYENATSWVEVFLEVGIYAQQDTKGSGKDRLVNIEGVYGSNYDDNIHGDAGGNVLYGGRGNDLLTGDPYSGGIGADTLFGGSGDDQYYVNTTRDVVCETTLLNGTVDAGGHDFVVSSVSWVLGRFVEDLLLSGSGNINATGNSLANAIFGNSGDNLISGAGGDDYLSGGDGQDVFSGGSGKDVFMFDSIFSASNKKFINDFSVVDDVIQISSSVYTKQSIGFLSAANFRAIRTGELGDANDYILYNMDNGALYYDADGRGGSAAVQFATVVLNGVPLNNFSYADIMIV